MNEEKKRTPATDAEKRRRQIEAVRRYEATRDRINIIFPAGTRERIEKLGRTPTAFIKEAVETALIAAERYKK